MKTICDFRFFPITIIAIYPTFSLQFRSQCNSNGEVNLAASSRPIHNKWTLIGRYERECSNWSKQYATLLCWWIGMSLCPVPPRYHLLPDNLVSRQPNTGGSRRSDVTRQVAHRQTRLSLGQWRAQEPLRWWGGSTLLTLDLARSQGKCTFMLKQN